MPFTFTQCRAKDGAIINGLYEIAPKVFADSRGYFFESYSERDFAEAGLGKRFVQDNQSRSSKGVLRGLHFQKTHPQGKLVRVLEGEVFDVAVDMRRDSATFGKWYGAALSGEKQNQLYIPEGFAHGFLVMSGNAVFAYKCTDFYHPEDEGGIIWNDPAIGIDWPDVGGEYQLSAKDRQFPAFAQSAANAPPPVPAVVWLIGCRGMLGAELARLLEKTGVAYVGTDCDIDITNKAALAAFARGKSIGWIVNCAAYTAVDNAEDDAEACRALNADGPANIAALAHSIGAKLIHISTDYVFNGKGSRPYAETDAPDPIGVYGRTKYDGEKKLLAANAESYVVRSAWLYGAYGKNFVDTMLRLMRERDSVSVVNDQRGSPTWARDLASAIIALMKNPAPYGTYHFTGAGDCTWFEFAEAIYRKGREIGLLDKDCAVKACASSEYPAKVARPAYSVLDKQKIKTALGIDIPSWDASLTVFLQEKEIAP